MSMIIPPQPEYELLDSGDEMKFERYGKYSLVRPDPQAIWPKRLSEGEWQEADGVFLKSPTKTQGDEYEKGKWVLHNKNIPERWSIALGPIHLFTRLTPFKHTAIFPEQFENWIWSEAIIKKVVKQGRRPKVLNLFGYTGGASVVCAQAGAEVTHVDASRAAITWAKENMIETGLSQDAIRWMLEDAVLFVKKELKRGNRYDAIMMDPPVFGRGAKGEVWKIERDLMPLLDMCYTLLSDNPIFFILNGYASGYSATAYANNLQVLVEKHGGSIESGELLIEESQSIQGKKIDKKARYLPCGIVARWSKA